MTEPWKPAQYHDTYREDIKAQIERRVKAGKTEEITEAPKAGEKARRAGDRPDGGAEAEPRVEARAAQGCRRGQRGRAANDEDEKPAAKRTATKTRAATKTHAATKTAAATKTHAAARKRA